MRQQMFRATAKSYIDTVKKYQESQADYESAVRDSASRRLRIVDPNMTDEDIESCIDEGRAEQVFQKVIRDGRKGQLANTYKGVAEQREVRACRGLLCFFQCDQSVLFVCASLVLGQVPSTVNE